MTTLQPKGDDLRNAVKWISDELKFEKSGPLATLIQKACMKFNLSPKDEEYLNRFYQENPPDKA